MDKVRGRCNKDNIMYMSPKIDRKYGDINSFLEKSNLILMRCSKWKDKYGNEIYEGDIIKKQLYTISRNTKTLIKNGSTYYTVQRIDTGAIVIVDIHGNCINIKKNIKEIEVIGNIYETPELVPGIKKKNKKNKKNNKFDVIYLK